MSSRCPERAGHRGALRDARLAAALALTLAAAIVIAATLACERERRGFRDRSPETATGLSALSELRPGPADSTLPAASGNQTAIVLEDHDPYAGNAYAVSEGKRLYNWFNCSGCHAHGGGDIGPPLMDAEWIYGATPVDIFTSIVAGRPNGMPAFRGRIPAQQVWQLVAYVRSLSGQLRSDVASGREDHMQVKLQEQSKKAERPVTTGTPALPAAP